MLVVSHYGSLSFEHCLHANKHFGGWSAILGAFGYVDHLRPDEWLVVVTHPEAFGYVEPIASGRVVRGDPPS